MWAAAKRGDVTVVKALLARGVDVNSASKYGATALSFACDRGHLEVAKVLMDAGANVNVKDSFYKATPLSWAAGGKHGQIVKLLLEHDAAGADEALRTAASSGSVDVARAVLQSGKAKAEMVAACRDLAEDRGHDDVVKLFDELVQQPAGPMVEVPLDILQSYVGSYQSDQGWEYQVKLKNDRLMIGSPYRAPVRLRAVDIRTFKSFETKYTFDVEDDHVVGFSLQTSDDPIVFKKLADDAADVQGNPNPPTTTNEAGDATELSVSSTNWPQFRGSGARGTTDGQSVPASWNVEKSAGVLWKTKVPGLAHSCPVVWGDRIFLTTAISGKEDSSIRIGLYGDVESIDDDSTHVWKVLCVEKRTGKILWEETAYEGVPGVKRHPKSTHANSTPATDGKYVVALFGSEGLYCYDVHGRLLWKKLLGDLDSGWFYDEEYQWGFGSSPIIFDEMVLVQCDVQQGSFVAAYDIRNGDEIWKTQRDEIPTWSTPTVHEGPSGPVLITNGTRFARGYNVRTGKELWRLAGHSEISVPTPFVADNLAFVSSGYRPIKPIYAIRLDARGDISLDDQQTSNEHIAWSLQQGGPYLPTPIVYRGYLYVCSNSGILTCYDAKTGQRQYQKRMRSGGAKSFTASPVAADGKLYFTSEEGIVLVAQAGPEYKLLHTNPVGESCLATPAMTQGLFILRTEKHLIAIGESSP